MEPSDCREVGKVIKEKNMLNTKFSEKELTEICQILKRHGTDCATLLEVLKLAHCASSNDARATYKHVRLMKEFGVINDRSILCYECTMEVINHHNNTCEEHKERMKNDKYFFPCPNSHYDYSACEPAKWMVDEHKIHKLEIKAAKKAFDDGRTDGIYMSRGEPIFNNDNDEEIVGYEKDIPRFDHVARKKWLEETFPDIDENVRFNRWMGFFCEKHIGSMRLYADLIMGYKN